jgi:hypothetical protein
MKKQFILALALAFSLLVQAQNTPFEIRIEPIAIEGLGGLQSFAVGQANGKWLLIGGRLDGLHRRQPWAAFDNAGHNTQMIVVDIDTEEVWTSPLSSLSQSLQDQLSSTNMEFHQEGDHLYLIGGYGYSEAIGDHTTHAYLSSIDVPGVIDAIISNQPINSFFRRISDDFFAVTGGHLDMMNGDFYLTGGQRFEGVYNPMNNPTFTQTYSNSIHHFTIEDDGLDLSYALIESFVDADNLHRRDFNVAAQIMPNGEQGITAFSGVFRADADLPFLNCVNIDASGYEVNNDFSQYFNHYHCANTQLYSDELNEMHTLFFGGIAQYYFDGENLVQDDNVPFVKTIARVTRDENGNMAEYRLPDLLGAGSEFIMKPDLPIFSNGVIQLDELSADTTVIGYVFGGIKSTDLNIFWINDGTQSVANNQLFKVSLVKSSTTNTDELNPHSNSQGRMQIYPNPNRGKLHVDLFLNRTSDVTLSISDLNGKILYSKLKKSSQLVVGKNYIEVDISKWANQSALLITISSDNERLTQKLILGE